MSDNNQDSEIIHDVVMIGAGPSALAAAIYTTREDIKTVIYEKSVIGGLAATTDQVDNYPGFADGVPGLELAENLQKQAERFGAVIDYGEVTDIKEDGKLKVLTVDGLPVKAKTVLIATGSDYNRLNIPGETENYGRGVHYCATCDGAFYRGKDLIVVGGGNSGVQEAIFLTRFASHIDLLVRSSIKASEVLQKELQKFVESGQITVHLQTMPLEIQTNKDGKVCGAEINHLGEKSVLKADGVFVFVGLKPNTQFLANTKVKLDELGLIKTDKHLETAIKGVFASGDVRSGATMQIATAVGEGATAALSIREYLQAFDKE